MGKSIVSLCFIIHANKKILDNNMSSAYIDQLVALYNAPCGLELTEFDVLNWISNLFLTSLFLQ